MKQKITNLFCIAAIVGFVGLSFSGCESDPRTTEYFRKNPEIAKARVKECKKMERKSEKVMIDCDNADWALEMLGMRELNFKK